MKYIKDSFQYMPYSDSRIIQNLSPFPENGNDQ